jgi:FdhD protein
MARVTLRTKRIRYAADAPPRSHEDVLAVEEPLQIRVRSHGEPSTHPPRELSVTMRTPGHDFDLVAGFLVGEGVLRRAEELVTMRYCAGTDEQGRQTFNVVDVVLAEEVTPPAARQVTTTSACGICGTTSIDEVLKAAPPWGLGDPDAGLIDVALLLALPERLRAAQLVCTPPDCSPRRGNCSASVRTSGGTTRSTRCSAGRCVTAGCRLPGRCCR